MADRPLLLLPTPTTARRVTLTSGRPRLHFPPADRQVRRLSPKFDELQEAFSPDSSSLQTTASGADPEQVIVLEIAGTVDDFANAVKKIEGLEWLTEWEGDHFDADEDFYDEKDQEKRIQSRLFLVMSNQRGMNELLSLWRLYKADQNQKFDHGLNKFRQIFKQLKDLRRWGEFDRIHETGVEEYWKEEINLHHDPITFAVEFWYRDEEGKRQSIVHQFDSFVQGVGGTSLFHSVIPEIAFHSAVVQLPVDGVQAVLNRSDTRLLRWQDVKLYRPVSQCSVPSEELDDLSRSGSRDRSQSQGDPVGALLDGCPLENHTLLTGRIILDDPDGWASLYPAIDRQHGTGMASLIIHGNLDSDEQSLERPLYVRPIMQPNPYSRRPPRPERIPETCLPTDLVHRAVRRMLEGEANLGPVAPRVRIINLSLADSSYQFDHQVSPWARLLDWLSWKYKVLFVVSAGNHSHDITLEPIENDLSTLESNKLERLVIQSISGELRHRRLLSPAESINSLTVGATHEDMCQSFTLGRRIDPIRSGLPSPANALGYGFRRSVKPDVLLPGGRQLYRVSHRRGKRKIKLEPAFVTSGPGIKVATPGLSGERDATKYACGTSNAAAIATRGALQLHASLLALRSEPNGDTLREDFIAVILKALVVHSASWNDSSDVLAAVLGAESSGSALRNRLSRFLGYGVADLRRALACTKQRATLIGSDQLSDGQAHEYFIPLPPSLSGITAWRRLTLTLAWFSPINPHHQKYRKAHLWFDPPLDQLRVSRSEAEWQSVRRGTIQHEVLDGDDACVIVDGDVMTIKVNCRAEAGKLDEPVPYALISSLEVSEHIDIPIYDEVRTRIRTQIKPPGGV